ncbi:ATP-binding protein [uncultured Chloroflexus sp.]|uniref:sensor histidine kinase n=1 Tax=uncultured Chloroflexus sp. TaxID=214040 RepID=UPI002613E55B|nr:ATP-binding protein [uncultured Chloroflexus sp.]
MNRLVVQLSAAFAAIILLITIILAVAIDRLADTSFRRYLAQSQIAESGLIDRLAIWYAQHGSWDGVEQVLSTGGMGMGHGQGGPQRPALALANTDGRVVADPRGIVGDTLTALQRREALPITVDQRVAGYLVVQAATNRLPGAASQFLQRLREVIWLGGGIVALVGIMIGILIARRLTRPLQHLAQVAAALGQSNLTARAIVEGPIEVRRVAEAFNEMACELAAANHQRRQMVADIAHELRTPLTVIQGNLRAILDDVYPLTREEIGQIYEATLGLRRLVDDLRELSLADTGQLTLHRQPLDLNQLLGREAELFRELAAAQGVDLLVTPDPSLPAVLADSERIAQVVRNLLSNALRYTPAGGNITIASAAERDGALVSVRDTGSGIAPEDLPHVFERFYRADRGRARAHGGSGLGLAIAERIIALHGGQIGVESKLDKGTRFWFWLPAAEVAASREQM